MNKLIFLILNAVVVFSTTAQFEITHQSSIGGNQSKFGSTIENTSDGGYCLLFSTYSDGNVGNLMFDEYENMYMGIVKYNASNQVEWMRSLSGEKNEIAISIKSDDTGIYVLGHSNSPVSGNKTEPNNGEVDVFLNKLNYNGDILWQKTYGGEEVNLSSDLLILSNNDLLVLGVSNSDATGDKSEDAIGGFDCWLLRIDHEDGTLLWDKTIGSVGDENELGRRGRVYQTNDNTLIFGATSKGNASGHKTEDNYGEVDIWLLAIDLEGNILWDKTIGGTEEEIIFDFTLVNDRLFVVIPSDSDISGARTVERKGWRDIWLLELSLNDGEILNQYSYGGEERETVRGITPIAENRLLLLGSSSSNASIDKEEDVNGMPLTFDYWPIVVDFEGKLLAQKTIGGGGTDIAQGMIKRPNDRVILMGHSSSKGVEGSDRTAFNYVQEFDPFGSDIWLVEINAQSLDLKYNNISSIDLSAYPNPCTDELNVSFDSSTPVHRVSLFDLQGNHLWNKEVESTKGEIVIPVKNYPSGVYFLSVSGSKASRIVKIIKQ